MVDSFPRSSTRTKPEATNSAQPAPLELLGGVPRRGAWTLPCGLSCCSRAQRDRDRSNTQTEREGLGGSEAQHPPGPHTSQVQVLRPLRPVNHSTSPTQLRGPAPKEATTPWTPDIRFHLKLSIIPYSKGTTEVPSQGANQVPPLDDNHSVALEVIHSCPLESVWSPPIAVNHSTMFLCPERIASGASLSDAPPRLRSVNHSGAEPAAVCPYPARTESERRF